LDDLQFELFTLGSKGYCCSQILVILALRERGEENPGLVRSMAGLCHGIGGCGGVCGVLTGAAALLGLYAGKGTDDETESDRLPLMLSELHDWFSAIASDRHGGINCTDILGEEACREPDPERCGGLLLETYDQVLAILEDNGFDPDGSVHG
jgi:C_GCAxxG_C_C family probable redox protein